MLGIARRVVASALAREESRGTHARRDFPSRDDASWRCHLVHAGDGAPARQARGSASA